MELGGAKWKLRKRRDQTWEKVKCGLQPRSGTSHRQLRAADLRDHRKCRLPIPSPLPPFTDTRRSTVPAHMEAIKTWDSSLKKDSNFLGPFCKWIDPSCLFPRKFYGSARENFEQVRRSIDCYFGWDRNRRRGETRREVLSTLNSGATAQLSRFCPENCVSR